MRLCRILGVMALTLPIVMAALTLSGCRGAGSQSFPVDARLSFSDLPTLGKAVNLKASFRLKEKSYEQMAAGSTLNIWCSEGFEVLSGESEWTGNLYYGRTYEVSALVRVSKPGTWTVAALAYSSSNHAEGSDVLYVIASASETTVSRTVPYELPTVRTTSPP